MSTSLHSSICVSVASHMATSACCYCPIVGHGRGLGTSGQEHWKRNQEVGTSGLSLGRVSMFLLYVHAQIIGNQSWVFDLGLMTFSFEENRVLKDYLIDQASVSANGMGRLDVPVLFYFLWFLNVSSLQCILESEIFHCFFEDSARKIVLHSFCFPTQAVRI